MKPTLVKIEQHGGDLRLFRYVNGKFDTAACLRDAHHFVAGVVRDCVEKFRTGAATASDDTPEAA